MCFLIALAEGLPGCVGFAFEGDSPVFTGKRHVHFKEKAALPHMAERPGWHTYLRVGDGVRGHEHESDEASETQALTDASAEVPAGAV
jgi:hypothetical protein|eukprot:COSAG06_NODE_2242_length_7269_cov_8.953696_1_plen_88_part_00